MPIAPVAGQTRRLDGHHGADAALADRRQQLLKSRTSDTRARATEIVVDDADIGPTELSGALDESILPPAAFDVVDHLTDRRLADIDDRLAGEWSVPIRFILRLLSDRRRKLARQRLRQKRFQNLHRRSPTFVRDRRWIWRFFEQIRLSAAAQAH